MEYLSEHPQKGACNKFLMERRVGLLETPKREVICITQTMKHYGCIRQYRRDHDARRSAHSKGSQALSDEIHNSQWGPPKKPKCLETLMATIRPIFCLLLNVRISSCFSCFSPSLCFGHDFSYIVMGTWWVWKCWLSTQRMWPLPPREASEVWQTH